MGQKDYYDILGISKDASVDEIKKAFRRQAMEHHPDRGGDEAKFKEINEAYEILSNPEKKQRYDQFGSAGLGGQGGFNPGGFGDGGFQFDFGDGGIGDIFSSLFGRGRQSGGGALDIEAQLELEFDEAVFGVEKTLKLNLQDVCKQCQGSCAQPGSKINVCSTCQGRGQQIKEMRTILGVIRQNVVCSTCRGEGKKIENPCKSCSGKGVEKTVKNIAISIPAGIEDGMAIRLSGQGGRSKAGASGDLLVTIFVKPHHKFTRESDLILSTENINMVQAALGGVIDVETVDGKVSLKIPAGTQNGKEFKLSKKGAHHLKKSSRGDHIVSINVLTPTKLSRRQKQILEDFY